MTFWHPVYIYETISKVFINKHRYSVQYAFSVVVYVYEVYYNCLMTILLFHFSTAFS